MPYPEKLQRILSSIAQTLQGRLSIYRTIGGVIFPVFYWIFFGVPPWHGMLRIRSRYQAVALYCHVGQGLLEGGNYEQAKEEFEKVLEVWKTEPEPCAMDGLYLSNLFIATKSPDFSSAVVPSMQKSLQKLLEGRNKHITEKYVGDLAARVGDLDSAKQHYENAIKIKKDYVDALYTLGWFNYDYATTSKSIQPEEMIKRFKAMQEVAAYDYRVFHGLGYAFYLQAILSKKEDVIRSSLDAALAHIIAADTISNINSYRVFMDFGEIMRLVGAKTNNFLANAAVIAHEEGIKIIDDPKKSKILENRSFITMQFLMSKDEEQSASSSVTLETEDDKRAWANYQLALDYRVLSKPDQAEMFLNKAKALDTVLGDGLYVYELYEDRLMAIEGSNP